jgi:hypothetical protein
MQFRIRMKLVSAVSLLCLASTQALFAQKPEKKDKAIDDESGAPAVVWHDPGDISTLDLFYGAGGKEHAPVATEKYTFVKEDMNGTSPKFDVTDEKGTVWRVKLGEEPQSETAATRFLWAVGYFTDEDYYLEEIKVQGIPKLKRGDKFVSEDGTVRKARLERRIKSHKKVSEWDWFHNDCGPEREFNGLRLMMAFVNNWDLKTENNEIENVDGERRCVVTDVGSSLGKTGNTLVRSKSVEKDFSDAEFISKVTPDYVDFVMHSRPPFVAAINIPNEITRGRMENIPKHIPTEDVRWLAKKLGMLSEAQIRDAFRSAGYSPEEVDGYTAAVQKRIAELGAI